MDTQVRGDPSRYTKSTEKSQLVRIPSHLGIHLVTPKALKNVNFSGYPLTWVSISLHQKHSKISTFHDTLCKFAISASLLSWRVTCRYPTYGYYDIYAIDRSEDQFAEVNFFIVNQYRWHFPHFLSDSIKSLFFTPFLFTSLKTFYKKVKILLTMKSFSVCRRNHLHAHRNKPSPWTETNILHRKSALNEPLKRISDAKINWTSLVPPEVRLCRERAPTLLISILTSETRDVNLSLIFLWNKVQDEENVYLWKTKKRREGYP